MSTNFGGEQIKQEILDFLEDFGDSAGEVALIDGDQESDLVHIMRLAEDGQPLQKEDWAAFADIKQSLVNEIPARRALDDLEALMQA
jgi:hypothetical protein